MKSEEIDMLLDEDDELLLMQFRDGECGILSRVRARALLGRSEAARDFLDQCERTAALHTEVVHAQRANCEHGGRQSSVWSRVQQRIEQEGRTAILLGRREIRSSSEGQEHGTAPWQELVDRVLWGFGGAAVAATLLLVVVPQFSATGFSEKGSLAGGGAGLVREGGFAAAGLNADVAGERAVASGIRTASLDAAPRGSGQGRYGSDRGPNDEFDRPRMIASDAPDVVEVDWMRGGGRVRVIPDESERAPIIWVKRNNRALAFRSSRAVPRVDRPRMSVQPSTDLYDVEEGSLEQPSGGFFGQE